MGAKMNVIAYCDFIGIVITVSILMDAISNEYGLGRKERKQRIRLSAFLILLFVLILFALNYIVGAV